MKPSPSKCCTMTGLKLASLPTEILVEILSVLDDVDKALCRLVCKRLEYIICHNARLSYPLELAAAWCVDGHLEYPACSGVRLKLFRAHQEAWRKQDFRKRRTLDSSKYLYTPASSAYRGGILVLGVFNISLVTIPNLTPGLTDLLRTIYINELHVFYMWSAGSSDEPLSRLHRILDAPFSDFDLEPSQDLLVLWDSTSPSAHGLHMRFLSLREGTLHKRARMSDLFMPTYHFFPNGHPPDELYVFDVSSVQLSGEYALLCANQCRNVLVLNWVTGFHWVLAGSACCMISNDCLIVTDVHTSPPRFGVYRISPSSHPPAVDLVKRYVLPKVLDGVTTSIDCRHSPSYARHALTPETCALPFTTAPDAAMIVFSFRMRSAGLSAEDPDKQVALLCYSSRFLAEARKFIPKEPGSDAPSPSEAEVEWEDWGPDSSFLFGDVDNDDNIWSYALYGYRLMLDRTLYDFNPHIIGSSSEDGMELCWGTSPPGIVQWFAQNIVTHRPYRRAPIDASKVPMSTTCFFVDEDVLALEDRTGDNDVGQVVITQLTVGPGWEDCR